MWSLAGVGRLPAEILAGGEGKRVGKLEGNVGNLLVCLVEAWRGWRVVAGGRQ
jgi:hypothetical protein